MRRPVYLHSFAFCVGLPRPVGSLLADGVLSADSHEDCIERGITTFCAADRPIEALRAAATGRTLTMAGLVEADVVRMELRAQDCAAVSAGVEVAAERIGSGAGAHVLLVVSGHVPAGESRYSAALGTVFGDGAAACIVSTKPAGFELIALESWVRNTRQPSEPRPTSPVPHAQPSGEQLLQDFERVQDLLRTSYDSAGIAPSEIAAVCGTHGSQIYLELMAEAAGVPYERVYACAMQEFGHVLACDNFIALSHYLATTGSRRGRVFCLVGWAPWSAGVVLLRELA